MNITKGINLIQIKGKDKCDVARQKCTAFVIDAENVAVGPNLTCKFERQLRNLSWEVEAETKANLLAGTDLHCRLPESFVEKVGLNKTTSAHYRVSATNGIDGDFNYSNTVEITIYHSECNKANKKVCLIDDKCLMDQFQNPEAPWEVCDVSMATAWWSIPAETVGKTVRKINCTSTLQKCTQKILNCTLTGPGLEHAGDKEISWRVPSRTDPDQTFQLFTETWNSTEVYRVWDPSLHLHANSVENMLNNHQMNISDLRPLFSRITCEVIQIWPKKVVM